MAIDTIPGKIYPSLSAKQIKNPSRLYAFPLLGGVIKVFMLIPIFIEIMALMFANGAVLFVNSFAVLFTGRYWKLAYDLNLGIMRLNTKVYFFMSGLTNAWPGFSLHIDDTFDITIDYPKKPNRWFAFPIFGGLVRLLITLPFTIYAQIISHASSWGTIGNSFVVLFTGRYTDSVFEIARDATRLDQTMHAYFTGLSDTYPNFWVSMNHKVIKIILIILGILSFLGSNVGRFDNMKQNKQQQQMKSYYNTTYNSSLYK